jgi:hypothetical protein
MKNIIENNKYIRIVIFRLIIRRLIIRILIIRIRRKNNNKMMKGRLVSSKKVLTDMGEYIESN